MANVPEPVEVLDFKMKQLCKFRVTGKDYDVQDTSSLLATSNLFGLVFVGAPDKVIVMKVTDLVQIDNATSKKTEISSFPTKEIFLPNKPSVVTLSSDNLTLMVCLQKSGCPVGWMYDVRGFARQTGEWNPFQEVRLSSTEGVTVRDCAWNPVIPTLLAVCLSDGSLVAVEINNTQVTLNSLPSSTGAQAICWSPKGKQLVVARPGKLVQYKPDLKEAKTLAFNGSDVHMNQPMVCGLQWLSTSQFLVTFMDQNEPNSRPHLYIVNLHKSGSTTFIDYDDVCYGSPSERPHRYLTLGLPSWNVLLACSANAIEIAVLAQTGAGDADHPEWRQWALEGEWRAELPLNENAETNPMGMAIDSTSQIPISWDDNQTLPPAPILFVLSTHGLLCPFHIINLKNGAAKFNQAPQELSTIGERPALSGIGLKAAPLAASTPLPAAGKIAIPRTNLGERFAAFADAPSLAVPTTTKPSIPPVLNPAVADSFFGSKPQPQSVLPSMTKVASAPVVPAVKIEAAPIVPKAAPLSLKLTSQTPIADESNTHSSMGAAAAILRDEVAKFVQDLKEFKARSLTLKVTVASDEEKERLLKMTSDLAEFGVDLVDTTKVQDEEVRGLCTDLVEVAALLEDARVRHARRKNSRYSHLLKLRPLDPGNRRKMDCIERLHVHIEQQLVEASRSLDSISQNRSRDKSRKIEIPITQVIYEAIRNNTKVISQLKSRVERIMVQSKEQQLKLAGAAFEALRPKGCDESRKWESELAVLADSLLSSSIKGEGETQSTHSVIPQVSPDKQAMLRSVLAHRPVARIRAVRPESVAESRLLSNLTGYIHAEDKKDTSAASPVISQAPSKPALPTLKGVSYSSHEIKPDWPKMESTNNGLNTKVSAESSGVDFLKPATRPPSEIEDVTPPSSPVNLDQKAKSLGNQLMMSSLSLPSRITASTVEDTKPVSKLTDVKPKFSLPTSLPPPYQPPPYESKPILPSMPTSTPVLSFVAPKKESNQLVLGSTSLFGKSSFASAFGAAASTSMTGATASCKPTSEVTSSFAISETPVTSTAVAATSVQPQTTKAVPISSFGFAASPALSASASTPALVASNPAEPVPTLKTSFSFNVLSSLAGSATTTPASTITTTTLTQTVATPSNFTFSSTSLPPSAAPVISTIATTATTPLAFVAPSSTSSISHSSTDSSTTSSNPSIAPTSFSFSLAENPSCSSTGAPGATAPFTFNLSGTGSTTTGSTSTGFSGTSSTPVAGSLFSLTSSTKAPVAFGVVNTSSVSNNLSPFGQAAAPIATTATPVGTSLFGQVSTSATTTSTSDTGVATLFGQSKPIQNVTSAPITQSALGLIVATTSTPSALTPNTPATIFGRPVTTSAATGSLFGQPVITTAGPFSSSFGQSVFGQPTSTTSTTASTTVFGQSSCFGKPAPASGVQPASSFGSPSVFGQSSGGTSTGLLAGSVFGQVATSSATAIKPLFGVSAFGQTSANVTAPTSSTANANQGFGAGLFGNMGLGGNSTASPNANRNVFGGSAFGGGTGTPSGQGAFGVTSPSSFGVQQPAAAPAPSFGSTSPPSFGGFGQSQPAFGGAATFGGSTLFGSKPTFGGGATFGSPVNSGVTAKSETGFGAFAASSNVPTFGVLANSGPSFETLASSGNAQPAFGGAAFPSSNPPSFGGGSSFSSWR